LSQFHGIIVHSAELNSLLVDVTYCGVYATNKTGSSSDDWIYYQAVTHSLIITLIHSLYQLNSAVAHALGFSVHTSRFPATDVDAQL
jgi:hypothetical protein